MPKIYTIIVTYNAMRHNWIDRCLMSLQKSTVPTIPILIDNGSCDGTCEHIPTHYPNVVWLPQNRNLGFGQANNIGIRYALEHHADYVLLLNQDAAIASDAILKMLQISDEHSLISPVHLNGDGSRIDELFHCSLRNARNEMDDDLLIRLQLKDYYEIGEICAACWLMPKSILERLGGFNPLFFHYSEDNNYYHRMVYHNIKTLLVPKAFMYHDRTLYGNVPMYHKRLLHRDMVLIACDINHSFIQCIVEWLRVLFKCYMTWLPQKQYFPGTFFYEILWLIAHSMIICKSRNKEKTIGRSWL